MKRKIPAWALKLLPGSIPTKGAFASLPSSKELLFVNKHTIPHDLDLPFLRFITWNAIEEAWTAPKPVLQCDNYLACVRGVAHCDQVISGWRILLWHVPSTPNPLSFPTGPLTTEAHIVWGEPVTIAQTPVADFDHLVKMAPSFLHSKGFMWQRLLDTSILLGGDVITHVLSVKHWSIHKYVERLCHALDNQITASPASIDMPTYCCPEGWGCGSYNLLALRQAATPDQRDAFGHAWRLTKRPSLLRKVCVQPLPLP